MAIGRWNRYRQLAASCYTTDLLYSKLVLSQSSVNVGLSGTSKPFEFIFKLHCKDLVRLTLPTTLRIQLDTFVKEFRPKNLFFSWGLSLLEKWLDFRFLLSFADSAFSTPLFALWFMFVRKNSAWGVPALLKSYRLGEMAISDWPKSTVSVFLGGKSWAEQSSHDNQIVDFCATEAFVKFLKKTRKLSLPLWPLETLLLCTFF